MSQIRNEKFAKGATVRYKLAVELEEEGEGEEEAQAQASQNSVSTQPAFAGWRLRGSRAIVTDVGENQANFLDTEYSIEMKVWIDFCM